MNRNIIEKTEPRAAFYYSMPFQMRVLEPIAREFNNSLISNSFEKIQKWKPDILFTSDAAQIPKLRNICDLNNTQLVGLRHGVANKYIPTETEYAMADYICGSNWDKDDFFKSRINPRKKFLVTGNPWIDDIFKIPRKELNYKNPTILFAPTYNPEVSAAVFFKKDLVQRIREVYSESKIIIKPHPAILDYNHPYVSEHREVFASLVEKWKDDAKKDHNVLLIEDSKISISDFYSETDILISDGSSLVFEFMVLNRPILLYTSNKKIKIWDEIYDKNALANSKRNVGAEFTTKKEFNYLLKDAFNQHQKSHSFYQAKYSKEIFNEFTDGNSYRRVARDVKNEFYKLREEKQLLDDGITTKSSIRLIAFYLPQYHPVPENNKAWGKGFTEWTNVGKAKPLFPSHYQPQLPTELGYYDLRLDEVRKEQIDLAKEYGLNGFCYYYYWFNGKQILETPIQKLLANKDLDFPFCICWANENWTRKWDGQDDDIIFEQQHNDKDDINYIQSLFPYFADSRYIRVEGKLMMLIYRTELFPNIKQTALNWREEVRKAGLGELYLVRVESFVTKMVPETIGFDAAVEFAPDWSAIGSPQNLTEVGNNELSNVNIFDYKTMMHNMLARKKESYKLFRGVTPSWDNTARRGNNATLFINSSPKLYEEWLRKTIEQTKTTLKEEEQFVFINAWNEWAEGNRLEPDLKYEREYLEATRNAFVSEKSLGLASLEEAEQLINDDRLDEAKIILYKLLEVDATDTDALNDLAFIFILSGNYKDALNIISGVLTLDPQNEIALGNHQYILENHPSEEFSNNKSENGVLSGNNYDKIVEAEKLIEKSDFESAKIILEELIKKDNSNTDVLNNLAVVFILTNKQEEAKEIISRVLELDPTNELSLEHLQYLSENQ